MTKDQIHRIEDLQKKIGKLLVEHGFQGLSGIVIIDQWNLGCINVQIKRHDGLTPAFSVGWAIEGVIKDIGGGVTTFRTTDYLKNSFENPGETVMDL